MFNDNKLNIEEINKRNRCPICGAYLTSTSLKDYGGEEEINYYCKKCKIAGR